MGPLRLPPSLLPLVLLPALSGFFICVARPSIRQLFHVS
nr:MAG TPA: hypothetical protein [Caudoviricetes sp.]